MEHLTPREFEALVTGSTDEVGEARLRHLAACADCAGRLEREARLELALRDALGAEAEVRAKPAPRAGRPSLWRVALPVAAALAIVAASVRFLSPGDERVPTPVPEAASGALAPDTPCLVDPRSLGPGHDVVARSMIGLDALAPQAPCLMLGR